jgi:hypothetical protein
MPHVQIEERRAYHRDYKRKNAEKSHRWGKEKYQRRKDGQPEMLLLKNCRARAVKKGLKYDLSPEWIRARWDAGCELTGLPFERKDGRGHGPRSASIDRIDNTIGYLPANCRLVLTCVNMMKHTDTEERMIEVIRALSRKFP